MPSNGGHNDTRKAKAHPDFRDGTEACTNVDNPEIFFPLRMTKAGPAKRVCRSCPHTTACLEFALATDQRFGIWGATTPRERINILKKLGARK